MKNLYTCILCFVLCHAVFGQTSIPANTLVNQNFNSMAATNTLPSNWRVSNSAGTGITGAWSAGATSVSTNASSGTPTTGGSYSWGTSANERAVGFMSSGSYATTNSVMAYFRNNTGNTITTLNISYQFERYRINTSAVSVAFYSSTDGTNWTARTAGDISTGAFATGTSAYSFSLPATTYKTVQLTGLNIANSGDIYLKWVINDGAAATAQGVGLDEFTMYANTATPVMSANLGDHLTDANGNNKANYGETITYRDTIKNSGSGDATSVQLQNTAPTGTTLTGGTTKSSALARDDSYANGVTTGNVLTNDFGLPSLTVVSFGPTFNSAATAAGNAGTTDNGGTITVNADGSFTYTPAAGFSGYDKFKYIASTGVGLPDNDAIVTFTVGTVPSITTETFGNVIGNVSISSNVITNDGGTNIRVVAVNGNSTAVGTATTTGSNGTLTVNADGTFSYNPAAGYTGTDAFTYTVDNGFGAPQTTTVNITIAGMIWFVNNNAVSNGDGRLSSPFKLLSNVTGTAVNQNIFLYESASAYTGGITLLSGQKLIGQDANQTLAAITGYTVPSYSTALPVMNTAGNPTFISNAGNIVTLSTSGGNLVQGLSLYPSAGAGVLLSGVASGNNTFTDLNMSVSGTAIGFSIAPTSYAGTVTYNSGTITNAGSGSAFNITGSTASMTFSGSITQSGTTALLTVTNHSTGTLTFNTGTLSATNGTGLQFDNADGTYNFNGTTTLNGGDAGIDITNGSGGTFSFNSNTSITNPTGVGFNLAGGTAAITYSGSVSKNNSGALVNVSGGHATGTVTFQTGTLSATSGTGLQFDNADGTYNFNGTTTLNGGDAGIDILNGSGGAFTFTSGTSITSPSGVGFNIGGTATTAAVTYSGSITYATASTAAVSIATHSAGTVTFQTGTVSITNGTGLQFSDADGTYNFNVTTTLNGGDAGIDILSGSTGTFAFTSGTAITSPSGTAFNVNASSPALTYAGSITQNNAQRLIAIDNTSSNTITFNTSSFTAGTTSTGVYINAANGNVTFANGLTLGSSGARQTATPLTIAGGTGTYTFNALNLYTNGVTALSASLADGTISTTSGVIDATSAAAIVASGASSSNTLTLNTTLTTINSTGGTNNMSFTNCTTSATTNLGSGSLTGASSQSFYVSGSNPSITYSGTVTQNNANRVVEVASTTGGTVTLSGTITAGASSTGVYINTVNGTVTFTTLNLGTSGSRMTSSGVNINAGTGTVSLGTVDIYTTGVAAINATAADGVINSTGGTVDAASGSAIAISGAVGFVQLGMTLTTVNSTGSTGGNANLSFSNCTGTAALGTGALSGSTGGSSFKVSSGSATYTYAGSITQTAAQKIVDIASVTGGTITLSGSLSGTGSCTGLLVSGCTGGTINFSGTTKTLTTTTNTAVNLSSNSGATINFSNGGLAITTTSGGGFNATGGATSVTVTTGTNNNTITSTSGTALNVNSTTIGASGLTFYSISANGAANGILLNTTGSSGSLTVSGSGNTTTGGNSSGGTIQNTTGHGVSLTSTLSPSLTNLNIQNTSGSGIEGTGVTNVTIRYCTINNSGTGGTADDSNIAFNDQAAGTETNISGVVDISGNILTTARWHGIMIQNFNGTISDATISNNIITSSTALASSLGYGINFQILGSASTVSHFLKATISSNTISNFPSGGGIQIQGGNSNASGASGTVGQSASATNVITITSNLIKGESSSNRMNTSAILYTVSGKGQGNVNISNNGTALNPLANTTGTTIGVGANGNTTVTAVTNGNYIQSNHPSNGGTGISGGCGVTFGTTDVANLTWTINSNTITNTDGNGILAVARGATGTLKITIKNNSVAAPLGGVRPGIRIDAGNTSSIDDAVCLDIQGNTSAGSSGTQGIGLRKQGTTSTTNDFGIEGMAATSSPNIETYINGLNPAGGGTLLISATSGFSNCSTAPRIIPNSSTGKASSSNNNKK